MKLHLTKKEFEALYQLLQGSVVSSKPIGIQVKLFHGVMMGVYKKFYKKAFDMEKRKYTLTLETHEACAWWLFFNHFPIPADMLFETNLLLKINNSIHKLVA